MIQHSGEEDVLALNPKGLNPRSAVVSWEGHLISLNFACFHGCALRAQWPPLQGMKSSWR